MYTYPQFVKAWHIEIAFNINRKKRSLFWIDKLHYTLVLWIFDEVGKFASWKLKNKSYFPNHNKLIRTLHLCQKYTIKRHCLQELLKYISWIMCLLFLQVCLLVFSTFFFGKLVFHLLLFIICFLFFMSL